MEAAARMPRQIPFIIANEGCERFSYYGMRNILVPFLAVGLFAALPKEQGEDAAKDVFHTFAMGVYFFPLLGGWLADRWFGKYNTILWFSVLYCAGQGVLAAFSDEKAGIYLGLSMIALGSGGIKPLVSSFMGDQFDSRTKHLAKMVFDAFYWIINFGSLFATIFTPILLDRLGPRVAFGVPGVLMAIATFALWAGRRLYVMIPPPPRNPDSFLRVVMTALSDGPGKVIAIAGIVLGLSALALTPWIELAPAICLGLVIFLGAGGAATAMQLERARGTHPDAAIDGVRAVLGILVMFAFVTPFWSLFDQKASTWVIQGSHMVKPDWFKPAQMQALNPALVMLLIPFNNLVLYPWLKRRGWELTALRRMTIGIAFAGVAYVIVGAMQLVMDGGAPLEITWQILPYVFLTMGEVLVSATGLEFAYSQAPPAMKGILMSFWTLSVTVGNLWTLLSNAAVKNPTVTDAIAGAGISNTAFLMFFFALFAFAASIAFGLRARRYTVVDNYR